MENTLPKTKNAALSSCFEWVSMLIGALVTMVLVFAFLFRVVAVSGDSMENTLHSGDRLVLFTQFYRVERGDVVVIGRDGEGPYIKRVIALEGDTIDINAENGSVTLNGEVLDEPYVLGGYTPAFGFDGPYTVKKGEIFAMGDNREWSLDCRELGPFCVDDIIGEAVFRLFPFSGFGRI